MVSLEPARRLAGAQAGEDFVEDRGARTVVATRGYMQDVMRQAGWRSTSTPSGPVGPPDVGQGRRDRGGGFGSRPRARSGGARGERVRRALRSEGRLKQRPAGRGTLAADAAVEREGPYAAGFDLRLLLYAVAAVALKAALWTARSRASLPEGRSHRWRDARDAELTLRAPVLGVMPAFSSIERGGLTWTWKR